MNSHSTIENAQHCTQCKSTPVLAEFYEDSIPPAPRLLQKESFFEIISLALLLGTMIFCLFRYILQRQNGIFSEFEAAFQSLQWMLLVCIAVWCGTFIFLTFSLKDLPLIGLLLIAIAAYFPGNAASSRAVDAIILLAGVTMGRAARFALRQNAQGTGHGHRTA